MRKGSDNAKKIRKLCKKEITQQLSNSLISSDKIETEEPNEKADKVEKSEDVATIIKGCKLIICTKKKKIVCILYHQEKVFKRFKEKQKFIKLVNEINVHKTTMIFKINIVKPINTHLKLVKSSVTLGFLENHYKGIKQICNENLKGLIRKMYLFDRNVLKLSL